MNRTLSVIVLCLIAVAGAVARTGVPPERIAGEPPARVTGELTALLREFLAGASRNDPAVHERFWADDLIYTASAGRRFGKGDILSDVRSAPAPAPGDPVHVYTAEEIRVQQPGDGTAVVAFRLVETITAGATTIVNRYLNTGTLRHRDGRWQAVAWQATRMPRPVEDARREVVAAQDAFHRALLAADLAALETLLDERFDWTHDDGDRKTGRQLMDALRTGQLKYASLECRDVEVTLHGDAAVVHGATTRRRVAYPGSAPGGDPAPFTSYYTLTFVNVQGAWRAVALHTSRP